MGFTMYGLMHFEVGLLQYVAGRVMDDYINGPHLSPWSKQSSSYGACWVLAVTYRGPSEDVIVDGPQREGFCQ